jgi:hypothetical protein
MIARCIICLIICGEGMVVSSSPDYLFDRPICTGLGDRLGIILSLSALAYLEPTTTTVHFVWCETPMLISDHHRKWVPTWTGFNYSLPHFNEIFGPISNIELVAETHLTGWHWGLPKVKWQGLDLPGETGMNMVYTLAWRTMLLHRRVQSMAEFEKAYRHIARPFAARHDPHKDYIVLHMRGPDTNTVSVRVDSHDTPYCTGKVVRRIQRRTVYPILVVTNNESWANALLSGGGDLQAYEGLTAYDDVATMLGARGIIQHAWEGWSSYSTVPAMAAGIPVINTYMGQVKRMDIYKNAGGAPAEMFDCRSLKAFMHALS